MIVARKVGLNEEVLSSISCCWEFRRRQRI